ncbi:MAG: Ntn hydrolase family protein [Planctomycetota bacterium]|jgi:ATP-dependent HslUV protease subunit HslV
MSIIVAITREGRTVIAADQQTSFGEGQRIPAENSTTPKILPVGDALVGGAGWGVYDHIMRHYLARREPPAFDSEAGVFEFFLGLWKALHDDYTFVNDQAQSRETPFGDLDSTFLIASPGGIFKVSTDMDVCRFDRYFAIGSGADYALGALHALDQQRADLETMARGAVAAAMTFDTYCGGEVDIREVRSGVAGPGPV